MLTEAQLRLRDGKITASFLPALMVGDSDRILNEWRRLVADPLFVEPDFADNWAVNFGSWVEPFALDWHQRRTGRELLRRGEVVNHPTRPYVCCTLDAYRPDDAWVLDVKAIGGYRKIDDVCAYYLPQLVVQRACVGGKGAALLIVHGGAEPIEHPAEISEDYERTLWERVDWFYACVENLTRPVAVAPVAAPVSPEKWRQFDLDAMEQSGEAWPNWAYAMQPDLGSWKETAAYAKNNARATKAIKELLPEDVSKLTYAGVSVTRAKNGAVTIK